MEITPDCKLAAQNSIDFNFSPSGSFRIAASNKKSKTLEFFDLLYSYPPQFRVKWENVDDLHDDRFMGYNYRRFSQTFPYIETVTDFFSTNKANLAGPTKYTYNTYFDSYLNKRTSNQFYGGGSKKLQRTLQNVPIYVILNGQGEIVLANSTNINVASPKTITKVAYDFCGQFDPLVERKEQLGLFFMSKADAEVYLNEIAAVDALGTKSYGLSIHCLGLDCVYRIMRAYNPNVDFRFIPDLKEVQTLLTSQEASLLFDYDQQQLRFRQRSPLAKVSTIANWIPPLTSFLQKADYFKGVPIYIVKVNSTPTGLIKDSYTKTINFLDHVCGGISQSIKWGLGLRNDWILQGSTLTNSSISTKTYVFFEKDAAVKFCKQQGRKVLRYNGGYFPGLNSLAQQPQIGVYNLEDFLEVAEESYIESQLVENNAQKNQHLSNNLETVQFVPAKLAMEDVKTYSGKGSKLSLKNIGDFLTYKYRRLSGFMELMLNTN